MHTPRTQGNTLIETIIYVAIFTMLSLAVINSYTTILSSFSVTHINRVLLESGFTAMERMSREIRQATAVDVSVSNTTLLGVNTKSATGVVSGLKFILEDGHLNLYRESTLIGNLIAGGVRVSDLMFREIITPEGRAIKIEMTLTSEAGSILRSENFYTTVIVRADY